MYIHIGGDYAITEKELVGIMDIENSSTSRITREFLASSEKEGKIINVSSEMPKSFIVTESDEGRKVYVSPVSSKTLLKRIER